MIDQIFDRNTSMEQKSMILASIILGVRELAGTTIDPKNEQDQVTMVKKEGNNMLWIQNYGFFNYI